jgi:DNA-binding LacI/PurR family transcriptional regulator
MVDGGQLRAGPTRIVDVARRAGVSAQTVSNVINARKGYSQATHEKVIAAVKELQYRPNHSARSLRLGRTRQIGFHLSGPQLDVRNPFAISFLQALVQAAEPAGYEVVIFTHVQDDADGFRRIVGTQGVVDGFVLCDCEVGDPRARLLAELSIPFVAFGRLGPDLPQVCVDIDNAAAIATMVDHLVSAGHRTFGYLSYPGQEYWTQDRLRGARSRLAHHGFPLSASATHFGTPETIRPGIQALLNRKRRPSAIITGSDSLAATATNIAIAMGLRVGGDVAISGFDGGPLQRMVEPPLTTVRVPIERIANAVMDRFVIEMESGPTDLPGVLIPTELSIGSSA